jgi:hypothetical protein
VVSPLTSFTATTISTRQKMDGSNSRISPSPSPFVHFFHN